MKWENFTAGRVAGFKCDQGKKQSIFWDGKTPGLGLRVTAAGSKSYIFETTIQGKTLRITIGDVSTYTIEAAQKIAKAYRAQTDKGIDPRQVAADKLTNEQAARDAKQAESIAMQVKQARESVKLGDVWPEYLADRAPQWGERTLFDHQWMIHAGGEKRTRSPKLTIPGPLASLALVRLVDLTPERVETWAKVEAKTRATRARLALRLLKACLNWCAAHSTYAEMTKNNAAKSR